VFNGWLVYESATSNGYIGNKALTAQNPIDRSVHPVDRGNIPADGHGPLPGPNTPVPQRLFDPGMNPATGLSNNYLAWKGGCGREPVNASGVSITSATEGGPNGKTVTLTLGGSGNQFMNVGDSITVAGVANANYNGSFTIASLVGGNQITYISNKTGLAPSSGGTVTDTTPSGAKQQGPGCIEWCGDPWGSWGYDTHDAGSYTLGFTHTYLKTIPDPLNPGQTISGLPEKICVNFYDVHGGGTTATSFQLVNGAKEVQVDGNGDNSINTNAFNVNEGANCTSVIGATLTTTATNSVFPGQIHDTAHIDVPAGAGGTLMFHVYGPRSLSSTQADCSGQATNLGPVTVNGPGDYNSPNFTPPSPGKYDWTVEYSGDSNAQPPISQATSSCGAANETSTVTANPTVTTDAGPNIQLGSLPGTLTDSATLSNGFNPTGTITFTLFGPNNATCSGNPIFTSTKPVSGNGSYQSDPFTPVLPGTYRWIANYSGDVNNPATTNQCNGPDDENVDVDRADSSIVTHQSFIPQDNATVTGVVQPTGTVTFELYKNVCSGAPVFSQQKTLVLGLAKTTNNGNSQNGGYTASGNGTWFWKVHYSGDGSNDPSDSNCVETFKITEP